MKINDITLLNAQILLRNCEEKPTDPESIATAHHLRTWATEAVKDADWQRARDYGDIIDRRARLTHRAAGSELRSLLAPSTPDESE